MDNGMCGSCSQRGSVWQSLAHGGTKGWIMESWYNRHSTDGVEGCISGVMNVNRGAG